MDFSSDMWRFYCCGTLTVLVLIDIKEQLLCSYTTTLEELEEGAPPRHSLIGCL